ncbi:MAG: AAA family ATPase [Myxococcales bacterium]|nr:AAA family ATPase [Myxococcales bacterium]
MFSFLRLELMNWDLWDHVTFPMDEQVVVVSGPNGSGKTTLLDAIRVLLGTKALSTSRKMSGYLRPEVKVAVIKALVSNPLRRGHGRRPFTRKGIFEDTATLACVIENRSGTWHRRYHILPGDAPMSQLQDEARGMGPDEYSAELTAAGLPRTLLKVLALEQGETHAMVRRTPVQLLEYVLEMQGDKAVLDAYEVARQNYALSRQEHEAQELKAREAERALELTARDAQSYQEFQALSDEITDIELRRLPAARWHELQKQLRQLDDESRRAQEAVSRFEDENADRIAKVDRFERDIQRLQGAVETKKGERRGRLEDKESVDGRSKEVRIELKRLEALKQRAEAAPEGDVEALEGVVRAAMLAEADAERRLSDAREERKKLETEVQGLGRGEKVRLPRFVVEMKESLRSAGIVSALVLETIEVAQPKWQKAVESVLGRDRFTVLVEAKDALEARKLAAKQRYPAYVAALEGAIQVSVPPKSALSAVKLLDARIPGWVKDRLAETRLVDSVKEGYDLSKEGPTIDADGYRQDARGGVYVGVEDLYCGAAAGEATKRRHLERLTALDAVETAAEDARRAAALRAATARQQIEAISARALWAEREHELPALLEQDKLLSEEKRLKSQAIMDVLAETESLTKELASRESELSRLKLDGAVGEEERRRRAIRAHEVAARRSAVARETEELGASVGPELRSEAAGELLESPAELRGRVNALKQQMEQYDGCKDPGVLMVLGRQRAHHEEQLSLLTKRESELHSGEEELRRARASYIRVADATISRYARALKELSGRAGMEVDVRRPKLTDDDDALKEAGLDVRLGFDGKRPIPISDPKLSGGQKVLASLLLLVALTYEGDQEGGGFFILDEPFAHLSVERIDHVARFIGQTRSQFLLTTPTTHNFAVFNAAKLLLTLRKKKPEMAAAPPPLYVRA